MAAAEQEILADLTEKWVSLAHEYSEGAHGVSAYYLYGSFERGYLFANAYFEQDGEVVSPTGLDAPGADMFRAFVLKRALMDDMKESVDRLVADEVPAPTEYRLHYVVEGGKLDFQLSREELYGKGGREKGPEQGIEYWLGDRAPGVGGGKG